MSGSDVKFVHEIQARHGWPVLYGVGPFQKELDGRVAIEFFGGSLVVGHMMIPRPEYESLPEDVRMKLGTPLRAIDAPKEEP